MVRLHHENAPSGCQNRSQRKDCSTKLNLLYTQFVRRPADSTIRLLFTRLVDVIVTRDSVRKFSYGSRILSGGHSPNESENSITNDRHPAHPRRYSIRCTRRVACHLHSAGSAQPATTCPCRSFSCTRDGQFRPQTVALGVRTCGEPGSALTLATVLVSCYLARWRSGLGPESKRSLSASCQP